MPSVPTTTGQPSAGLPLSAGPVPLHAANGIAAAEACLQAGGMWAQAVDLIASTAILDIQRYQGAFLASAVAGRRLAELYGAAFTGAGLTPRSGSALPARTRGGRTRVLFVTFQISQGQAASASLARWLELLDPDRFEAAVMCADELSERRPALGVLKRLPNRSDTYGPELIEQMKAAATCAGRVTLLPVVGDWLDATREGVRAADAFSPDIAVFIASPACPVQAGMVHRRIAPVQVNMNIGSPLPVRGMDAVIYHNDLRAADDLPTLAAAGIAQHRVVTIGTDLRQCLDVRAPDRRSLGFPDGAVVLLNVANQVAKRLVFDGFIDGLIRCLRENPRAWWVGVGGGETGALRAKLAEAGVIERCVLTGSVSDPRPIMAAADILLNEYPEGGGNTVLEAMGIGTPVVAMYAGRRHAESIGAVLAGPHAVPGENDRAAYWRLVQRWIDCPQERGRVGAEMKRRAHAEFDYIGIVKKYEAIFDSLLRRHAARP